MITVDDLLIEYTKLAGRAAKSEGLTSAEIMELTGWHDKKIRRFIKLGLAAGTIKFVRKKIVSICGVEYLAPAYIISRRKHASN